MRAHLWLTNAARCTVVLLAFAVTFHLSAQQLFFGAPEPYIVAQDDYGGENGNPGGAVRGYPFAQTFTPTTDGTLFSIAAGFVTPYTPSDPYYIFQFRDTTAAGLPGSQVIASVNVPTAILSVPPAGGGYALTDLTADFSSFGIPLLAGHKYALSVDVPGPFNTTIMNNFFWGLTGSGYAGGKSYYFTTGDPQVVLPNENFLFTVKAVPEPSVLPLAVTLSAWVLRPRRRQGISPSACKVIRD